jgi:hypothetical protein
MYRILVTAFPEQSEILDDAVAVLRVARDRQPRGDRAERKRMLAYSSVSMPASAHRRGREQEGASGSSTSRTPPRRIRGRRSRERASAARSLGSLQGLGCGHPRLCRDVGVRATWRAS